MERNLRWAGIVMLLLMLAMPAAARQKYGYKLDCIWDNGTYNAFTSLVKFQGRYYCAFREGRGHVFDENGKAEGKIRILCSKNGKKWESVLLTGLPGLDFRDPKLSVMPDGRLMVSIGVSTYINKELRRQDPYVCFSADGKTFTTPQPCRVQGQDDHQTDWLWRVTWQGDTGYAVNYFRTEQGGGLWLYTTRDGIDYQKLTELDVPDFPNESTVRFLPESGKMAIMVRRDGGDCMGYWGLSEAPYTQWEWKKMPIRLGGPDFLMLDDRYLLLGSRCYHGSDDKTAIYIGDAQGCYFNQVLLLPSMEDTSYPGMLIEGDELWVTYYSAHETKWPSIYLARIPLSLLMTATFTK